MITPDQLRFVVQGIGTFGWNGDYKAFCEVTGFQYNSAYSKEKWEQWQQLQQGLKAFDEATLMAFIQAGHASAAEAPR